LNSRLDTLNPKPYRRIFFAAVAEITAMAFLCAYYLSWAASFSTFTVVVGAVDHRSGLERGVSGDTSEWDDEEGGGLLGIGNGSAPRGGGGGGGGGGRGGVDSRDVVDADPPASFYSPSSGSGPGGGGGGGSGGASGGVRDRRGAALPSLSSVVGNDRGGGGSGGGGGRSGGTPGSGVGPSSGGDGGLSPSFRHQDGRVVNGLRASPATPGVPRVDSSDRIYQQLHEPFMRNLDLEQRGSLLGPQE